MICAVTGPRGAGKSSTLLRVANLLETCGVSLGGVISAPGYKRWPGKENTRTGYTLINLGEGTARPLACMQGNPCTPGQHTPSVTAEDEETITYGAFRFYKKALEEGNCAISKGIENADYLFIDEIGLWEFAGGGWNRHLHRLRKRAAPTVLGLRQGVAQAVEETWNISITCFAVPHDKEAFEEFLSFIRQRKN